MKAELKNSDGKVVATIDVSANDVYTFELDTVWGKKSWALSFTYLRDETTHKKDLTKLSGAVLQGVKQQTA